MEKLSYDDVYCERMRRVARAVGQMSVYFVHGDHNTVQSDEYEAWRLEYLQAQTDAMFLRDPPGTHSHYNCG